ncbi:prostatic steroid-binding protein C1-like [Apodemus sylvaticus]|uniref:prostatic steroid-binding protein C1-like n=1 Tax=Apodemus sylvaticus TaxID=10129 RepID=UPI002241947E|nr:prostatic steroid-binding protein C1-like [Apodemus sylvaticus]
MDTGSSPFAKSKSKPSTMRLILCLLLITLAVPCYGQSGGFVCEAVLRESLTFVLRSRDALEKELNKYSAPAEAVEAKLKVKECVDETLDYKSRLAVGVALKQILIECGAKGLLEQYLPLFSLGTR